MRRCGTGVLVVALMVLAVPSIGAVPTDPVSGSSVPTHCIDDTPRCVQHPKGYAVDYGSEVAGWGDRIVDNQSAYVENVSSTLRGYLEGAAGDTSHDAEELAAWVGDEAIPYLQGCLDAQRPSQGHVDTTCGREGSTTPTSPWESISDDPQIADCPVPEPLAGSGICITDIPVLPGLIPPPMPSGPSGPSDAPTPDGPSPPPTPPQPDPPELPPAPADPVPPPGPSTPASATAVPARDAAPGPRRSLEAADDTGSGDPRTGTVGTDGSRQQPAPIGDGLPDRAVLALVSSILLAALGGIRALRLHRRVTADDALDHEIRSTIVDRARADPGITPAELADGLDVAHETVLHHVRILEDLDHLVVRRDGKYIRLFVDGTPDRRDRTLVAALRRDGRAEVLRVLRREPGLTISEIARRLDRHRTTAQHHVDALAEVGLVEEVDGEHRRLTIPDPVAEALEEHLA